MIFILHCYHFFYLCSMNQLALHIEYLLHEHNCVIVPGFGGFVTNTNPSVKEELSIFHSPHCELVFNRLLTHNDGLLVESFMRTDNISFESALQKIEKAVKEFKSKLREEKKVQLGDLGEFEITADNRFVYNPVQLVRPEFYGLDTTILKPIVQLQPKSVVSGKPIIEKKKYLSNISISAAVAAVIAIVFFVFPIQDSVNKHQSAKILSETNIFAKTEQQKNRHSSYLAFEESLKSKEEALQKDEPSAVVPKEENKYAIIVGVYEVREIAEKMIAKLKEEGFNDCNSIDRAERIDVYAASFSTKEEAEKMARDVRNNFNSYKEAWVKKIR